MPLNGLGNITLYTVNLLIILDFFSNVSYNTLMNRKWNYEKVSEYFSSKGFRLLESEYINTQTKMRYLASCGHEHQISFENLKMGKGGLCTACRHKRVADMKRYTYDEVAAFFEKENCKLISDIYISANYDKVIYIAQCGHENKTTFGKFLAGGGRVCNKCSKSIRYDHDYVEERFAERDCILLTEYVNCKTPLRFIAACGHEHTLSFDSFQSPSSSNVCPLCNKSPHRGIIEIRKLFADNGCKLLSTVYLAGEKLEYVAQCGHKCVINLPKFLSGQGRICPVCARPRGENHHAYNPDITDKYREAERYSYKVISWRNMVYKRDKFTCCKCGDSKGGNLFAHHLDGYNWCKEKRYDTDNGVTLCEKCHKAFHSIYGFGNNTKDQYSEWVEGGRM